MGLGIDLLGARNAAAVAEAVMSTGSLLAAVAGAEGGASDDARSTLWHQPFAELS
jgi:hypothetical protein